MTAADATRSRWENIAGLGSPGRVDAATRAFWLRWVRPVVRAAFRPEFDGADHLPREGPYLLVANHSGMGNAEVLALIVFFLERLESLGPVAAMVHPLTLKGWPQGRWIRSLGAIPSTYEAALAALAGGVPVLVMPGGDHEAQRPVWLANKVQFAGRKGFLKIARAANVPIVPMGISGSHYTAPILWRSDRVLPWLLVIPRLAGVKRYALTLLGAIGVFVIVAARPAGSLWLTAFCSWLWLILPFATLPWIPWKIRARFGAAIPPGELFDGPDSPLDAAYQRVESAVQALVTRR